MTHPGTGHLSILGPRVMEEGAGKCAHLARRFLIERCAHLNQELSVDMLTVDMRFQISHFDESAQTGLYQLPMALAVVAAMVDHQPGVNTVFLGELGPDGEVLSIGRDGSLYEPNVLGMEGVHKLVVPSWNVASLKQVVAHQHPGIQVVGVDTLKQASSRYLKK